MFDDLLNRSSEHEPDEPDPEAKYAPDIPSVSDTSAVDVPPELAQMFWRVVISVNVGVLAVCLGLMFIYFRGQWRLGGGAVVFGVGTFVYAYLIYWRYTTGETPADFDS